MLSARPRGRAFLCADLDATISMLRSRCYDLDATISMLALSRGNRGDPVPPR